MNAIFILHNFAFSCKDASFTVGNSSSKIEIYHYCEYLHNGQGTDYLILAGTIFLFIFCVMGVIMGYLSDKIPRYTHQLVMEAIIFDYNPFYHIIQNWLINVFIFSRPKLMAICTMLFSVCGMLTGLAQEYWHLVILRMGVAAG